MEVLPAPSVPANVWLGTTIEDSAHPGRADFLRRIDARVRFISAEPLFDELRNLDLTGIHWLIVGGESGSHLERRHVCRARVGRARGDAVTTTATSQRLQCARVPMIEFPQTTGI